MLYGVLPLSVHSSIRTLSCVSLHTAVPDLSQHEALLPPRPPTAPGLAMNPILQPWKFQASLLDFVNSESLSESQWYLGPNRFCLGACLNGGLSPIHFFWLLNTKYLLSSPFLQVSTTPISPSQRLWRDNVECYV